MIYFLDNKLGGETDSYLILIAIILSLQAVSSLLPFMPKPSEREVAADTERDAEPSLGGGDGGRDGTPSIRVREEGGRGGGGGMAILPHVRVVSPRVEPNTPLEDD